jgi:hypothetical protein
MTAASGRPFSKAGMIACDLQIQKKVCPEYDSVVNAREL